MVINGTNGIDASKVYAAQQQCLKSAPKKQGAVQSADRADILDISQEARLAHAYRAALKSLPEVRQDLVAAVKQGIQAGTYQPDPIKIAEGILELSILVRR